jgi:3-dehydroquinate dehydratase-2
VGIPAVEVHLSDVDSREDFRKISFIGLACVRTIKGMGFAGYIEAIRTLEEYGN